jgi:hypothetical protein
MVVVVLVVLGVALIGTYLTWTAKRLDRLHSRLDAAAASLDLQLVRRADAARALATAGAGSLGADRAATVLAAVDAVRAAGSADRVDAENRLGAALRSFLADPVLVSAIRADPALGPLLAELDEAAATVALARRFHATAVEDTLGLRRRRVVRMLGLAGHAPMPQAMPIADTPVVANAPVGGAR